MPCWTLRGIAYDQSTQGGTGRQCCYQSVSTPRTSRPTPRRLTGDGLRASGHSVPFHLANIGTQRQLSPIGRSGRRRRLRNDVPQWILSSKIRCQDGGIRTRRLLLPNQLRLLARRRWRSLSMALTWGDVRCMSPNVVSCLPILAARVPATVATQ